MKIRKKIFRKLRALRKNCWKIEEKLIFSDGNFEIFTGFSFLRFLNELMFGRKGRRSGGRKRLESHRKVDKKRELEGRGKKNRGEEKNESEK